jgi:hypothetical protein
MYNKQHAHCYDASKWNRLFAELTTQHNTTPHITTQHNTTHHNTTQHNTTQHNTTSFRPWLWQLLNTKHKQLQLHSILPLLQSFLTWINISLCFFLILISFHVRTVSVVITFNDTYTHTHTHTHTLCRSPLNEGSVRRRDVYLTTQNTHSRQTSMSRGIRTWKFQEASSRRHMRQTARPPGTATSSPCSCV